MCSRRDFLRVTIAASSLGFAPEGNGKAKSCILLWMSGAMSQIDTFDLKAGNGPFKEIETAARGVRICEHLPRTAKRMADVSLIRTLNSRDPNHDTASYLLHTGYRQNSDLRHPHLGSVVLEELGPGKTDLPGCVVLGGDPPAGSAYLPAERNPAVFDKLDNPGEDVIASNEVFPKGTLDRRWSMLKSFDEEWVKAREDARVEGRRRAYERAWKILSSKDLRAFDLSQEPEPVRKAYGPTPYGRALLLARRLVQTGVRFVEVQYGGWDSHADNFTTHQRLMGDVDAPYAALLEDLSRSGMLSETLVLLMSEFGRTPRVNVAKGRDHWTRNWCAALAGGGVEGGRVVGKTDAQGMDVAERPVGVNDLFASIYHCFGVKTAKEYLSGGGRPIRILDGGEPVQELSSRHGCSVGMTMLMSLLLLAAQDVQTVKVGAQAPEFKVKDAAGKDIDLAELTAKGPVLVRLTCGCLGCDQEIKYFKTLQDTYRAQGLQSLAIFKEPDVKVEKYAADKQLNMLYSVDEKGKSWKVWQTKTMPTNFLIAKGGQIIAIEAGCDPSGLIAKKLSEKVAGLVEAPKK